MKEYSKYIKNVRGITEEEIEIVSYIKTIIFEALVLFYLL